jgi:hypothetical protein
VCFSGGWPASLARRAHELQFEPPEAVQVLGRPQQREGESSPRLSNLRPLEGEPALGDIQVGVGSLRGVTSRKGVMIMDHTQPWRLEIPATRE